MFNILRFIIIVTTALVVFCWGVTAGQSTAPGSDVSWHEVKDIRVESMPVIPDRVSSKRGGNKRGDAKTTKFKKNKRFAVSPKTSRPDFGPLPPLRWKARTLRPVAPARPQTRRDLPKRTLDARGLVDAELPHTSETMDMLKSLRSFDPAAAVEIAVRVRVAKSRTVPTKSKSVSIRPAEVNYDRLRQKITEHNLSVGAVEDQLNSRDQWDLESLESIVSQIKSIQRRQKTWQLYWRIVDAQRKRELRNVASLEASFEKLQQRIFETTVAVDVDIRSVSDRSYGETKARLAELDELVNRWSALQ